MPLATEEEWENDPELKAMRAEFVASFAGRRETLSAQSLVLARGKSGDPEFESALKTALGVAHKLSGAAETYGFPLLTRASAALEEWCGNPDLKIRSGADASLFAGLLVEMLAQTQQRGKDSSEFASDPRLQKLESAVGALKPD